MDGLPASWRKNLSRARTGGLVCGGGDKRPCLRAGVAETQGIKLAGLDGLQVVG